MSSNRNGYNRKACATLVIENLALKNQINPSSEGGKIVMNVMVSLFQQEWVIDVRFVVNCL